MSGARGRAAVGVVFLICLSRPSLAEHINAPLRDTALVARAHGTPLFPKAVPEVVQGVLTVQETQPDPASIDKLAGDALDSLIALELLYQESQARGIQVDSAAVDAEIARSRRTFGGDAAFERALKAKGMTQADLRRDTQKTMAVNRLLEGSV